MRIKWQVLLLAIWAMLLLSCTGLAQPPLVVDDPNYLYATDSEGTWIVSGKSATYNKEQINAPFLQVVLSGTPSRLYADDSGLYVYYENGRSVIERYSKQGKREDHWEIGSEWGLRQMVALENDLALLLYSKNEHSDSREIQYFQLALLSRRNGYLKKIPDNAAVASIAAGKDQQLWTISLSLLGDCEIVGLLNLNTYRYDSSFPLSDYVFSISDGISRNTCYLLKNNGVVELDLENGFQTTVLSSDDLGTHHFGGMLRQGNLLAIADEEHQQIIFANPSKLQAEKKLTLVNCTDAIDKPQLAEAVRLFKKRYPEFDVVLLEIPDEQQLATALMAADPPIDVLQVALPTSWIAAGALMSLSQFPDIEENIAKNYLNVDEITKVGNERYCIPGSLFVGTYRVNEVLLKEAGITLPEILAWEELYHIACEARKDLTGDGLPDIYLLADRFDLPTLLQQLFSLQAQNDLRLDTPEVIALLESYRKMVSEDLIVDISDTNDAQQVSLLFPDNISAFVPQNELHFPLFTVSGQKAYPSYPQGIAISSRTQYPKQAAYLLSCITSREAQSTLSIGYGTVALFSEPRRIAVDKALSNYGPEFASLSEYQIDFTRQIVENAVPTGGEGLTLEAYQQHLSKFLSGIISAEAFATMLQQSYDMVRYE